MKHYKRLSAIVAICLTAVAVPASAATTAAKTVWECVPTNTTPNGWITKKYFLIHDAKAGTAEVLDGVPQYFKGGPVPAEIAKNDDKSLVLRWNIKVIGTRGSTTMRYDATLVKATHEFRVNSTPGGYDNSEHERGTCKIAK